MTKLKLPPQNFVSRAMDSVVSTISPSAGVNRLKARAFLGIAQSNISYEAADEKRSNKHKNVNPGDGDQALIWSLPKMRNRIRALRRNNPIACGIPKNICTHVIGTGLTASADIDGDVLGLGDDDRAAKQKEMDRYFHNCANSKEIDQRRQENFYQLQPKVLASAFGDGDCFSLFRHFQREGSPYLTKLLLIEADQVSNPKNAMDNGKIAGGIELDSKGAFSGIHLMKHHPGGYDGLKSRHWTRISAYAPDGEANVLHIKMTDRIAQRRGVPGMAAIVDILKSIGDYQRSELDAAVTQSMIAIFLHGTNGGGLSAPTGSAAPKDHEDPIDFDLPQSAVLELNDKQGVTFATPTRPNNSFDPMLQAFYVQIGMSLNLPPEIITRHFQTSYSAARAAFVEAWYYFTELRAFMVTEFCDPVRAKVIAEGVASGALVLPGFFRSQAIRNAWLRCTWHGPIQHQIDELKAVKASREKMEAGLSTHAIEAPKFVAQSSASVLEQHQREKAQGLHQPKQTHEAKPPDEDPKGDDQDGDDNEKRKKS